LETEKGISTCQGRLQEIERNIKPNKAEFYENYKRNEFSTIWDDKKTLSRSPDTESNKYEVKIRSSHQQVNSENFKRNLLPTTYSNYGLFSNKNY
jgi:hypothetical protein